MADHEFYGMTDSSLAKLTDTLRELRRLYMSDERLTAPARGLNDLVDRIAMEERMVRIRLGFPRRERFVRARKRKPEMTSIAEGEDLATLIHQNIRTCEELSRTLEEYFRFFKLENITQYYKKARFDLYGYEREATRLIGPPRTLVLEETAPDNETSRDRIKSSLGACPLYFILDEAICFNRDPLRIAIDALSGGVRMMQLRFKDTDARQLLDLARKLRSVCEEHNCLLFINDRLDIALLSGAHGIHVGGDDFSVQEVHQLSRDLLVGVTARTPGSAVKARDAGADYLGVGSVYQSGVKPGVQVIGLRGLKRVVQAVEIPVVGIGGITQENCSAVMQAGAAGFCSITPFKVKRSVKNLVAQLAREALSASRVAQERGRRL